MNYRVGETYVRVRLAMLLSMAVVFCFSLVALFAPSAHAATATAVSTGTNHTCAVVDRKAKCWGDNTNGKLGNNSTSAATSPVTVYTKAAYSEQVDVCEWFVCHKETRNYAASPLYGKSVTKISAGDTHTCVVANARVYCWGDNSDGQLGNRGTTNSSVPVAVAIDSNSALLGKEVVDVSAGADFTCAVASDGTVACWGVNDHGQLGIGTTATAKYPMVVSGGALSGKKVKKLATVKGHAATMCAITSEGKALCWGQGYAGQTGSGGASSVSDSYHKQNTGAGNQCINFSNGMYSMNGYTLDESSDASRPVAVNTSLTFESIIITGDGGGVIGSVAVSNANTTTTYNRNGYGYTFITARSSGSPSQAYYWGGSTSYSVTITCKNRNGHGSAGNSTYFDAAVTRTYNGTNTPIGPQYQGSGTPLSNQSLSNISGNSYPGADFGSLFCGIRTNNAAYCDTHGSSDLTAGQTGSNYTPKCTTVKNGWGFDVTTCDPAPTGPQQVYAAGWLSGKTMTAIDTSFDGSTCTVAGGEVGCWGVNDDGQLGVGDKTKRIAPAKVGV